MLKISNSVYLSDNQIEINATGARGPGGQNVNKSATAAHLRFDVKASSLPDETKRRILSFRDSRISKSGVIVIKSQGHRSFEDNRDEALKRLHALIRRASVTPRSRKLTKPSRAARQKRLDRKIRRGRVKALRSKIDPAKE